MSTMWLVGGGGGRVEGGPVAAPVGLAFDDQFPGGGLQAVDRGLGEQGVGERGEPLVGGAVGGEDGGGLEVSLDRDLVEVGGLGGVVGLEGEVIDEEDVDADEPAQFGVVGVVEAGGLEAFEQPVGTFGVDLVAAAAGDVPERVR
jgi:hypothetical protein